MNNKDENDEDEYRGFEHRELLVRIDNVSGIPMKSTLCRESIKLRCETRTKQ